MKLPRKLKTLYLYLKELFSSYEIFAHEVEILSILENVLRKGREFIFLNPDFILNNDQLSKLQNIIKRRLKGEPLAYILGEVYFYGIKFYIKNGVFIPRKETEHLIDAFLSLDISKGKILDLCCGCGIIGLSLKKLLPDLDVTLSDISEKAIENAQNNSLQLNLKVNIIKSNLFENIKDKFNVIISNPPYIPTKEIENLCREVREYEPRKALDGGSRGVFFYNQIFKQGKNFLVPGGYIIIELNPFLSDKVKLISEKWGFTVIKIVRDYSGYERVLVCNL